MSASDNSSISRVLDLMKLNLLSIITSDNWSWIVVYFSSFADLINNWFLVNKLLISHVIRLNMLAIFILCYEASLVHVSTSYIMCLEP